MKTPIIFITGTDTGVGKTVFTGLLLAHLRSQKVEALAMKPFCSGDRGDIKLLQALQPGCLPDAAMNPFFFDLPVAPLVAARKEGRMIQLSEALRKIRLVQRQCECLLIEGAGGLMVPLGEDFLVLDLIRQLRCRVIVMARNKLGTINHTLLTVRALKGIKKTHLRVVLRDEEHPDRSAPSNGAILEEMLGPVGVFRMPFLSGKSCKKEGMKKSAKKLKKMLASAFASDKVMTFFRTETVETNKKSFDNCSQHNKLAV
jgi:dethiobiotin synthetase